MTVNKLTYPAKENAVQEKINEIIDNFPTGTVDQTFDGTSANAQSGVAINGELTSNYQTKLVSGTNIKTINNTSLLGSGNIDTTEVFVAEYNITDYSDVLTAYNTGKKIFLKKGYSSLSDNYTYLLPLEKYGTIASNFTGFVFSVVEGLTKNTFTLSSSNTWDMSTIELSDNTLSNVSSINSNSAVQTALDGKVSKSGDTMTGDLAITTASNPHFELQNTTFDSSTTTAPSAFTGIGSIFVTDTNGNYVGGMETFFNTDNTVRTTFSARRVIGGNNKTAALGLIVDSSGNASCYFPDTTCVDGQWTTAYQDIISSDTSVNGSTNLTKRVTVPNDGHVYEAMIITRATTTSTSGQLLRVAIGTNQLDQDVLVCGLRTRTNNTMEVQATNIVPIKGVATNSTNLTIVRGSGINGNINVMRLIAYRRVGTNA